MAKNFKLLLLDANVVIELFRQGIWEKVIACCDVHLARSVLGEAHFYEDDEGQRHDFHLQPYADSQRIAIFDMAPSALARFRGQFDPVYFEKLDPGETESLVYLLTLSGECWLCSADKIVFRVLANLNLGERGISLEELLRQTGLMRTLPWQFSKAYREQWTAKGAEEALRGLGIKKPKGPGKP